MKYIVTITGIAEQDDAESGNYGGCDDGDEVFSVRCRDDMFMLALSKALQSAQHSLVHRVDVTLAEVVEFFGECGYFKGDDGNRLGNAAAEFIRSLRDKRQSRAQEELQDQEV